MRTLRIPMLVDLVRTTEPGEIMTLSADPRLDRRFEGKGPLVNRLVLRSVRRVLQVNGEPLPPVAPAGDAQRRERQRALEERLATAPVDDRALTALADYIRGNGRGRRLGVDAQQAIGTLFDPAYVATGASFAAARVLSGSVRGFASPRAWWWKLTGRVGRSRALLTAMVGGDPSGVHGTGIAVHNLVESLKRMRALAATAGALRRYAPDEAASLCLSAPATVLREATDKGGNAVTSFRDGTLVLLGLEAARARSLGPQMGLMRGSWSQCPAHRWIPRLLAAVWQRAAEG